ncbi:hypothetical protein Vadar_002006 [Vaccinium darrowii]|uniref:Uncharacterized protein n=1 Tax=Vaccinium darrowii TaxID=229202 RepID=A0ACB7Z100_9ERIC|nr:hypothetical protein Vadar_002006 [Vaccinium darrowii]
MSYTHYFYEATVGAGLPIISTLQDLLGTGDKILQIEGIFSGTLSYIFNKFIGTRAFSELVMEAKKAGYTEPDPRDDLSEEDVARKVLRYVGVVDVVNQKGGVELGRYKKDHPFAHISECENIIIFTTERYMQQPLIVRKPGAGAQVTASGIFSDILRLAPYFGALS